MGSKQRKVRPNGGHQPGPAPVTQANPQPAGPPPPPARS